MRDAKLLLTSSRGVSLLVACGFCLLLHLGNMFAMLGARSGQSDVEVIQARKSAPAAPYRSMPVLSPLRVRRPLAPVPQVFVPDDQVDRSDLMSVHQINEESPDPLNIREKQMDMLRERALAVSEDDMSATLSLEDVEELNESGGMIW